MMQNPSTFSNLLKLVIQQLRNYNGIEKIVEKKIK